MQTYICKCGKTFKKSSKARSTGHVLEGYSPLHECYGCPFIVYEREWETKEITKYECIATPQITYSTRCHIGTADGDHSICHLYTLDLQFAEQVFSYIKTLEGVSNTNEYWQYEANAIPAEWRAADFGDCYQFKNCFGLAKFDLNFQKNKKGTAARRAVMEQFFSSDGKRKDIVSEAEERDIVLQSIAAAKENARKEYRHSNDISKEDNAMVAFNLGEMLNGGNTNTSNSNSVVKLPLTLLHNFIDIDGNEQPFNIDPSASDYKALKDSIKHNGVLTPISVRKIDFGEYMGEYEILSGHRRRLACVELGMSTIDAIIVDINNGAAYDNVVDSNIHRSATKPIELARMYSYYLKHRKDNANSIMTADMIATKFGVSKKQMYRYIKLLNFTGDMQECFNLEYINIANIEQLYTAIIAPALENGASKQTKERSIKQQDTISSYALSEEAKFTGKRMKRLLALIEINPGFTLADIDEYVFSSDSELVLPEASATDESDEATETESTKPTGTNRFSIDFLNRVAASFPTLAKGATEKELEDKIFDILSSNILYM